MKIHILRHAFAKNCIKIGLDYKILSDASVKITIDLYVHLSIEEKRERVEKINRIYSNRYQY